MARPAFNPTNSQRDQVAVAAGAGMSHEEIALAIGVSRPTLEKHFAHELSIGAHRKRMEVVQAMQKAAKKGNVAAQKAYMAMTPRVSAPPAPEKPLGKKEQARAESRTAQVGTEWETLLNHDTPLQ